jgi:hypothetical protein
MGKDRSDKEGHVRYNKHLGVHEARMYVPEKLRHLYGGQRTVSFYHKLEHKAIEKRAAAKREMDEGRGRARASRTARTSSGGWRRSKPCSSSARGHCKTIATGARST